MQTAPDRIDAGQGPFRAGHTPELRMISTRTRPGRALNIVIAAGPPSVRPQHLPESGFGKDMACLPSGRHGVGVTDQDVADLRAKQDSDDKKRQLVKSVRTFAAGLASIIHVLLDASERGATQLVRQFRTMPEAGETVASEVAEERAAMVDTLTSIDDATRARIREPVADNARFLFSLQAASLPTRALVGRPLVELVSMAIYFIPPVGLFASTFLSIWNVSHVYGTGAPAATYARAGFVIALLAVAAVLIHRIFRYTRLGLAIITIILLIAGQTEFYWRESVAVWMEYAIAHWPPSSISEWLGRGSAIPAITLGRRVVLLFTLPMTTQAIWDHVAVRITFTDRSLYKGPIAANALILGQLLNIAYSLESVVHGKSKGDGVYLDNNLRMKLLRELESLARYMESPWRRTMKTRNKQVDVALERQARGMAVAVRTWAPRIAIGGRYLYEARDAFAVALVNAADGDWDLLAAEVEEKASRFRKAAKDARRLVVVIALAIASIYLTVNFMHIPNAAETSLIATWGLILLTYIISVIDPGFTDRIGAGIKAAELLRQQSKD